MSDFAATFCKTRAIEDDSRQFLSPVTLCSTLWILKEIAAKCCNMLPYVAACCYMLQNSLQSTILAFCRLSQSPVSPPFLPRSINFSRKHSALSRQTFLNCFFQHSDNFQGNTWIMFNFSRKHSALSSQTFLNCFFQHSDNFQGNTRIMFNSNISQLFFSTLG